MPIEFTLPNRTVMKGYANPRTDREKQFSYQLSRARTVMTENVIGEDLCACYRRTRFYLANFIVMSIHYCTFSYLGKLKNRFPILTGSLRTKLGTSMMIVR